MCEYYKHKEKIKETKEQFETRYGKWLREMRLEIESTPLQVAQAIGISVHKLLQYENGQDILMYDALKLCEFYDVEP